MSPDELTAVIRDIAVAARRLDDHAKDIDNLAGTQREMVEKIGERIDGFRDACHLEVEGVHVEIKKLRDEGVTRDAKLREEIKAEARKREWTRPEKLMTAGMFLTFVVGILGLVFSH